MRIVLFTLTGDLALWRNVYDSIGSYSTLGPAPSALAGLCGSALGFVSPRSFAAQPDSPPPRKGWKSSDAVWPASPDLLQWLVNQEVMFACRWTASYPKRINWNVNGLKEIGNSTNLRMQQQAIESPGYEVAVRLVDSGAEELAAALKTPAFRLFLGCSHCPAIIRNIQIVETLPESSDWAFHCTEPVPGETVPFSQLSLSGLTTGNRLVISGYWVYPIPGIPGIRQKDPFIKGCVE